jgi:O-antigen ligase
MPNIGSTYEWYLHLPHNNLLWLAMTTGVLGLSIFAWFIASVVLKTVAAIKATAGDSMVQALFVLCLLSTAMFLTFALYDQGLLSQRVCLFMGVQFGLLALVPRLTQQVNEAPSGVLQLSKEPIDADLRA